MCNSVNGKKKKKKWENRNEETYVLRSDINQSFLNVSILHQNVAKFLVHNSAHQENQQKAEIILVEVSQIVSINIAFWLTTIISLINKKD